jgi:sugar (pentulose or hexulose) kinase
MTGLTVERPSGTEAAAEGAARQARWVLDGVEPLSFDAGARWEPRSDAAIRDARGRLAMARDAARQEPAG